eukprot:12114086-Prorocentrum_lima.AAC.1
MLLWTNRSWTWRCGRVRSGTNGLDDKLPSHREGGLWKVPGRPRTSPIDWRVCETVRGVPAGRGQIYPR